MPRFRTVKLIECKLLKISPVSRGIYTRVPRAYLGSPIPVWLPRLASWDTKRSRKVFWMQHKMGFTPFEVYNYKLDDWWLNNAVQPRTQYFDKKTTFPTIFLQTQWASYTLETLIKIPRACLISSICARLLFEFRTTLKMILRALSETSCSVHLCERRVAISKVEGKYIYIY